MMRISHTRRSRSPVTHPKTPVDSTPRPITAAAPRKRAPTHHYKSHPSYNSHHWLLPTKPPLSRFLQRKALTLPPLSCAVKPPSRVAVLVPAVDHSARRHHRPAPRDGLSPWARVAAVAGFMYCSFSPCSAATHARGGNMVFGKPLLLRKSNERPSRLTHG